MNLRRRYSRWPWSPLLQVAPIVLDEYLSNTQTKAKNGSKTEPNQNFLYKRALAPLNDRRGGWIFFSGKSPGRTDRRTPIRYLHGPLGIAYRSNRKDLHNFMPYQAGKFQLLSHGHPFAVQTAGPGCSFGGFTAAPAADSCSAVAVNRPSHGSYDACTVIHPLGGRWLDSKQGNS